ncbi:hypothetical protein GTA08_BOTSDO01011 [Neofusicoccum parvum]|uniref:Ca2+-modulated nonselective cation channel polycystin protein n=3 Tax=Neofusicoccum TaxID=407951 RepID=R1G7P6_BOTPV|nr:hypothetical protein UCRNP2_5725 [Neofusicoccum parvum UCRNP2]GME26866.1 hypothetical protein GTA08_BOTSDO01011 [Neofusicoccum parvum]GME65361.1 hypothetical protein GTA08_BOTSDO01011 [Neofusicoccum parvum]
MKDRHTRRRPFAAWIKRVANLKGSSNSNGPQASKSKNKATLKNNPYPESGHLHRPAPAATSGTTNGHLSFSEPVSRRHSYDSDASDGVLDNEQPAKSAAPTLATNPETIYSDAGQSKAETSNTRGGAVSSHDGGGNSTFSSPNHSERSLTTTLTTIQSTAPSAFLNGASATAAPQNTLHPQSVHFSHQYPVSPASAVPAHLQPHPNTYQAATAGNILSDNASIMTLASSSKRRRRNSLDTNASVRALAPSSVWGGSRESLPLSVLSGNVDAGSTTGGIYQNQNRPGLGGVASAERASVYSSSGAAPALNSERNSYYAGKQGVENGSIRSGLHGHGRAESLSGSLNTGVGGPAVSPLASPVHPSGPGRMGSRRSSNRRDDDDIEEHEEHQLDDYDHDDGDAATSINGGDVKAPASGMPGRDQDIATDSN